jgi:hypothetical protein
MIKIGESSQPQAIKFLRQLPLRLAILWQVIRLYIYVTDRCPISMGNSLEKGDINSLALPKLATGVGGWNGLMYML